MESDEIVQRIKKARFVFTGGNGGSASTAEHFANDLFKKGIKAICLNSNLSMITMIANDYGYDQIFSKQLELYANKKDFVILFSVSGKSKNILKARQVDIPIILLTGRKDESYGDAENRHLQAVHLITQQI